MQRRTVKYITIEYPLLSSVYLILKHRIVQLVNVCSSSIFKSTFAGTFNAHMCYKIVKNSRAKLPAGLLRDPLVFQHCQPKKPALLATRRANLQHSLKQKRRIITKFFCLNILQARLYHLHEIFCK